MTRVSPSMQTVCQVETQRTILQASLHGPFMMNGGSVSPTVLRTERGWRLRVEEPFLVAEYAGEAHLVPLENVAGLNVAPAIPAQAPKSDDGATTNATTQPAIAGKRRAGGRSR